MKGKDGLPGNHFETRAGRLVNWRAVSVVLASVVVLGVVGVLALDRFLYSNFFFGPLDIFRPSMNDLLSGRVAGAQRQRAIEAAASRLDQIGDISGTTVIGRRVRTLCMEGSNTIWTHDGYRFKCSVSATLFLAGRGDVERARDDVLETFPSCKSFFGAELSEYRPGVPFYDTFDCGDGSLAIRAEPASEVQVDRPPYADASGDRALLDIVPLPTSKISAALAEADWIMGVDFALLPHYRS